MSLRAYSPSRMASSPPRRGDSSGDGLSPPRSRSPAFDGPSYVPVGVKEGTRDVSDALASGLAHLLDEAVEGPLQRAFKEIDLRFSELADVNDELVDRISLLEADNRRLADELNGVPLADEIERLESDNRRLTADLAREQETRHKETTEINKVLQQLSMFVHSLDNSHAAEARHRQESQLRTTMCIRRMNTIWARSCQ